MKPVTLPPGRAKARDEAAADRIGDLANTMGMVRVCCSSAAVVGVVCERMRSGCSATSSLRESLSRLRVERAQRVSIRMLRPSVHPSFWSPSRNAATQACASGSLSAKRHQHADPPHPARAAARAPRAATRRRATEQRREIPAASCPPPGSGDGIVAAQTSTLIGAETGFATAT